MIMKMIMKMTMKLIIKLMIKLTHPCSPLVCVCRFNNC